MTAIQKTLLEMQEENRAEFARSRRVQQAMPKTLYSVVEGGLNDMADHEEHITELEGKVFALETKA